MLRFLTAGESHGPALTVVVEGLPAGLAVDMEALSSDLRRRQGGYGRGGRMQIETDSVELLSGVRHGLTLGSPVTLQIRNRDFENWRDVMSPAPQPAEARKRRALKHPRPGHADLAFSAHVQTRYRRRTRRPSRTWPGMWSKPPCHFRGSSTGAPALRTARPPKAARFSLDHLPRRGSSLPAQRSPKWEDASRRALPLRHTAEGDVEAGALLITLGDACSPPTAASP